MASSLIVSTLPASMDFPTATRKGFEDSPT